MAVQSSQLPGIFVRSGVLSPDKVDQILLEQEKWDGNFPALAIELGYLQEEELMEIIARETDFQLLHFRQFKSISAQTLRQLPLIFCEQYDLIPIAYSSAEGLLKVAMSDPSDKHIKKQIKELCGLDVESYLASITDIRRSIRIYFYGESTNEAIKMVPRLFPKKNDSLRRGLAPRVARTSVASIASIHGQEASNNPLSTSSLLSMNSLSENVYKRSFSGQNHAGASQEMNDPSQNAYRRSFSEQNRAVSLQGIKNPSQNISGKELPDANHMMALAPRRQPIGKRANPQAATYPKMNPSSTRTPIPKSQDFFAGGLNHLQSNVNSSSQLREQTFSKNVSNPRMQGISGYSNQSQSTNQTPSQDQYRVQTSVQKPEHYRRKNHTSAPQSDLKIQKREERLTSPSQLSLRAMGKQNSNFQTQLLGEELNKVKKELRTLKENMYKDAEKTNGLLRERMQEQGFLIRGLLDLLVLKGRVEKHEIVNLLEQAMNLGPGQQ